MSGIMYGYARVSTRNQREDRQLSALRAFGVAAEHITVEKQSGKDFDRPLYQRLTRALSPGDVLVVKSIDRLGRNYAEILDQWARITKTRKAAIVVLDMPLLDTRAGRDLTGTLSSSCSAMWPRPSGSSSASVRRRASPPPWKRGCASGRPAWSCRRTSTVSRGTGGWAGSTPPRRAASWASPARPSPAGPPSGARPPDSQERPRRRWRCAGVFISRWDFLQL